MTRAPLSPDEATQRAQVRRILEVLAGAALVSGALVSIEAVFSGNWRSWAIAAELAAFAALLVVWPRRILASGRVESAVTVMALASTGIIFATTILSPSGALIAATALLIPITAAVPYLEVKSLRRLIVVAWAAAIATAAASLLPDPSAGIGNPAVPRIWGSAVVYGLVLFLLYQSSERMKASSREFRRLFSLSSELAESSDPRALGDLVARHLAEATGLEDCVIHALSSETDRLTAFGSHPLLRSVTPEAESLIERPVFGQVIRDRSPIVIDVDDEQADASERARLRARGRRVMVLFPLVARGAPVGVAELSSAQARSIDGRRLALARTLAFEAAMAVENGRLYHELRERSLRDPLTGLANRSLFVDRVGHALARLDRQPGASIAVLYLDLDGFKKVNDTFGHAVGDRLLEIVAERLLGVVRAADTVARLGGDEFALLLEDLVTANAASLVAERAVSLLAAPFDVAGGPVTLSVSIGVAVRADAGTGTDELIHEADGAMYEAKRQGKGRAVHSRHRVAHQESTWAH